MKKTTITILAVSTTAIVTSATLVTFFLKNKLRKNIICIDDSTEEDIIDTFDKYLVDNDIQTEIVADIINNLKMLKNQPNTFEFVENRIRNNFLNAESFDVDSLFDFKEELKVLVYGPMSPTDVVKFNFEYVIDNLTEDQKEMFNKFITEFEHNKHDMNIKDFANKMHDLYYTLSYAEGDISDVYEKYLKKYCEPVEGEPVETKEGENK